MKKFLVILMVTVFAVVGSLIVLNSFGSTKFQIDAISAELKIDLKKPGTTEVYIPPLGHIKASTHRSPVGVGITLESIDLNKLKTMVEEQPKADEFLDEIQGNVRDKFKLLIYKSLLLGAVGGALSILILQRKRWHEYVYGTVVGIITVALVLTMTYKSYDIEGFQNPEYEGMLKTAPWMISLVQEGISKFDLWGEQLQAVAVNLYAMFERVDSLEAMGSTSEGDLQVLHISDVHNNPASLDFVKQVVDTFQIDIVIDTGDLSDFGTPLEGVFAERLGNLGIPYVFVPGNHETKDIINKLKSIPNVEVLEGQPVTVKSVNILGIPDPSSYSTSIDSPDSADAKEMADKFKRTWDKMPEKPDILAVHNHRFADELAGTAPIILHGHDHSYKIKVKNNSVLVDAGTTGASGIGGLETKKVIPYSLVVLQLKKTKTGIKLMAADTIKVSNLQSGYSIERRMFPELYQDSDVANKTEASEKNHQIEIMENQLKQFNQKQNISNENLDLQLTN